MFAQAQSVYKLDVYPTVIYVYVKDYRNAVVSELYCIVQQWKISFY